MHKAMVVALAVLSAPVFASHVDAAGIGNFHQVNDHVYRGAQPTEEGFRTLARLGVKQVLDLRREDEHSSEMERRAIEAAGMRYVNIPMNGIVAPTNEQISKALDVLRSNQPVFVHCKEGKDRTGAVIACYRIAHDGWDQGRALSEAKSYGMHWFEVGIKAYVLAYGHAPASTPTLADATIIAGQK